MLAAVSSFTAIAVAVITVSSQSDDEPATKTAAPPRQIQGGVAFRTEPDFAAYASGWSVAFAGPLPDVAQYPNDKFDYVAKIRWAKSRGAVDVSTSHLRLYLQNNDTERVTIRSINAKVTERQEPISETYLDAPAAGVNELVELVFDLDSADLVPAAEVDSQTSAGTPFFASKNVTLDAGETVDFRLTTTATKCLCRYRFVVEIVKVDSTLMLEVGDSAGRPFTLSGAAKDYANRYVDGGLPCQKRGIFPADAANLPDCVSPV